MASRRGQGPQGQLDYAKAGGKSKVGGAFVVIHTSVGLHGLRRVMHGCSIEFDTIPLTCLLHLPRDKCPQKHQVMLQGIQHLLEVRTIKLVPEDFKDSGVYSVFFKVPKKNGKVTAILDLQWLNKYVKMRTFRLETLNLILMLI